ncbi:MAG TPA: cytochrome c [Candidatus Angelobacter sp.]|nr:cytochrome c [Candidatus Angelobacter sp.]
MKTKFAIVTLFLTLTMGAVVSAAPKSGARKDTPPAAKPGADNSTVQDTRLEGELRFRANCGRCHAAPRKFPPRLMATVVRHMRVRATLTDEDTRLILSYMTE